VTVEVKACGLCLTDAKSPIPVEEMIDTTAAFEAVTASIEQRTPVAVAAR
jgi:hypothetical protein